jgi:hypothetical protein
LRTSHYSAKDIATGIQSRQADPARNDPNISGGDIEEATPDPIPNSEVKLFGADGTAREAVWESRTLPGFILRRLERFYVRAFSFFVFESAL